VATKDGQRTTLIDTVGHAINMAPVIQLIDPFDVGLLSYIGMASLDNPATAVKHEWMEDTLRPLAGVLDEALDNSETDIDVVASLPFRPYDLIKIDSEIFLVLTITDSTTIAVETRGTRSTAASHDTAAVIQIVGTAVLEGQTTPREAKSTEKTGVFNYTQIFEDVVEISSTLEAIEQYAPGSEYARELGKTMKSLFITMDRTLIFGYKYVGTSTLSRSMDGLYSYLTAGTQPSAQKVDASSVQLTEKMMLDALLSTYDNGGVVRCHAMTLTQKNAQNKFLDQNRRTDFAATMAGSVVDSFLWDQGVVDTVIDRWLPTGDILGLDTEMIGCGPLQAETLGHEILPKQSRLAQRGQITGEYTMEFKSPKTSYYIHSLATDIS
jgi:hypothetical protein